MEQFLLSQFDLFVRCCKLLFIIFSLRPLNHKLKINVYDGITVWSLPEISKEVVWKSIDLTTPGPKGSLKVDINV